ncbi:MAG: hypothetical protein IPH11_01860 [Ignavibacteriales bacterium]|nr:hypothetical protein [Ignavibacteriales bacterium]
MKTMAYLSFLLAVFLLIIGSSFAQDTTQQKSCCKKEMKEMNEDSHHNMDMDNSESKHQNMDMDNHQPGEQSILREGEIDLKGIDMNKDGKVYQDVMDWNVISDTPGECPVCGMELKEVSLEKATENLIKNNFKVK